MKRLVCQISSKWFVQPFLRDWLTNISTFLILLGSSCVQCVSLANASSRQTAGGRSKFREAIMHKLYVLNIRVPYAVVVMFVALITTRCLFVSITVFPVYGCLNLVLLPYILLLSLYICICFQNFRIMTGFIQVLTMFIVTQFMCWTADERRWNERLHFISERRVFVLYGCRL